MAEFWNLTGCAGGWAAPLALELAAAQLRVLSLPNASSFTPITSVKR